MAASPQEYGRLTHSYLNERATAQPASFHDPESSPYVVHASLTGDTRTPCAYPPPKAGATYYVSLAHGADENSRMAAFESWVTNARFGLDATRRYISTYPVDLSFPFCVTASARRRTRNAVFPVFKEGFAHIQHNIGL